MSDSTAILYIILPQALRLSIPGWSNEYSIILKDSAVTFALGVPEIMARTHFVATRTYQHLPLYILAGLDLPGFDLSRNQGAANPGGKGENSRVRSPLGCDKNKQCHKNPY